METATCMGWGKLISTITAGAVVLTATFDLALGQQIAPKDRVFVYNSQPIGQCPALDWHIVAGANNTLYGMIAWNSMQNIAKVTGSILPNRTFTISVVDVAGGRGQGATVTGRVRPDGWIIANINGPNIDCQGISVPWYVRPPAATGAGMG
jgi:hypothetical protein